MRQIYPAPGPDLELVPAVTAGPLPAAVADLAALYPGVPDGRPADRTWLRANMVTSADGAAAVGGKSRGLSGRADRMLFAVLRSLADVILVGSGTVRTERYRPVATAGIWAGLRTARPAVPAIAVVTRSLDLGPASTLLDNATPDAPVIVITTEDAPVDKLTAAAKTAHVIVAGDRQVDLPAAVSALADLGYLAILAEGGPSLLGQLAEAALLDELCLTLSPVLVTTQADRIVSGTASASEPARLTLQHVLADDEGYLFCRYVNRAGM